MRWRKVLMATIAVSPLVAAASLADTVLGEDSRTALTLTVTQDDVALVQDRRAATMAAGAQVVVIEPMPQRTELAAGGLGGAGVAVRSQQVDPAGLNAAALLAAHRGKEVTVVWRTAGGVEREERATVLAADGQPLFAVAGKVVAGQPERIVYDTLPPGLRAQPALRAEVVADKAGKHELDLSYLARGLSWQPAYVLELGDGKALLSAWAELRNASGGDFPNARLRLLAGEVNRAAPPIRAMRAEKVLSMAADSLPSRQELGPYHLYSVAQPVSLSDGQSVQVPLLPPRRIETERRLELPPLPPHAWAGGFAADPPTHPTVVLELRNGADQSLPAGPARLFQRAGDGGLAFAGEDDLPMVPAGAPFRLTLGKAFDVTARRVQTDVQKVAADITETAWEVRLDNAGADAVKVAVREAFAGEWLVLEESQRHDKADALHAGWTVQVPAKGETVLRYRVRIKL